MLICLAAAQKKRRVNHPPQGSSECRVEARAVSKHDGQARILEFLLACAVRNDHVLWAEFGLGKRSLLRSLVVLKEYDSGEVLIRVECIWACKFTKKPIACLIPLRY